MKMLTTMIPILRRSNFVAKLSAPVYSNLHVQIFNHPGLSRSNSPRSQSMSTVIDDVLNEPKRNLDYFQLLEKKKNDRTVLIDVREHSEINETGKLPGSIHIPLNDLENALQDMSSDRFYELYKIKKPDSETEIIFSLGELSKALNDMSIDEFEKKYNAVQPGKDMSLIFSCKAGGRSLKALALAYALGYANAAHYKGGWLDWEANSKKSQS